MLIQPKERPALAELIADSSITGTIFYQLRILFLGPSIPDAPDATFRRSADEDSAYEECAV